MSNLNFLHSGGNKVTLSAPDSNPSSDVTLKLPQAAGSAGQVLQTDGNGNLTFVNQPTSGITVADSWRLTTNITSTTEANITSNWVRNVTNAQSGGYFHMGAIGSAMTESSGIFSFPSTGVYLVKFYCTADTNNSSNRFFEANIFASRDNFSSSQMFARGLGNMYNSTSRTYFTASSEGLFDVVNTSTHKVRFGYSTGNNVTISGTSYNLTYVTFIRLGDT